MSEYTATLSLPRSDLPARARLPESEPVSLARWASTPEAEPRPPGSDDPAPFVLHDGPPYANGPLHLGHLFNRVTKDVITRSRRQLGHRAPFVPGWDCHGLPVEQAARRTLGTSPDPAALRRACRGVADRWQTHQHGQMTRLLCASTPDRYCTMDPAYGAATLEVFARLVADGLVVRAQRPVRWSVDQCSVLAEAEVDWDPAFVGPSLWIDAWGADVGRLAARFGVAPPEAVALTAWTTAPWTVPANLGLAVDPDATYAWVEADGCHRVVALAAMDRLSEALLTSSVRVLGRAAGRALLGTRYTPFLGEDPVSGAHRVVAGAHVTLDQGSGLVHIAPGHGPEDHEVGCAQGWPIRGVLTAEGRLDDTVPPALRGATLAEADVRVPDLLAARGSRCALDTFTHAVPRSARGGGPVVYRCTPQWFVDLDRPTRHGGTLREVASAALADVRFVPETARRRLTSMVASRPSWCVSRQRTWGIPLPAVTTRDGTPVLTAALVRTVAAYLGAHGGDAASLDPLDAVLADWDRGADPDLTPALRAATDPRDLTRGGDVLDVWFDAGSSWFAVLGGTPADVVVEGTDQHRGWFQSSLLLAAACAGEAPFRTVVTHGFVLDRDRAKMSKSKRGTPDLDTLVERYGAEILRWWACSCPLGPDVTAGTGRWREASGSFRKVRDTLRFALGCADDLPTGEPAPEVAPTDPEAWLLGHLDALTITVAEAYRDFDHPAVVRSLLAFCSETLSATYLDAVKDRLYCDRPDSPRRRRCQWALHRTVDVLAKLLAPVLPHTSDEVWRHLHRRTDDPHATVHTTRWDLPPPPGVGHRGLDRLLAVGGPARTEVVGDPMDVELVLPDPDGVLASLDADDRADWLGVSRVSLDPAATSPRVVDLTDAPRCARSRRRHATVKQRASGAWLSDRDADALQVLGISP